jgi:crotonobetainyl-CoA:carnitine CoA-transferase CaiB-like acyl-CoA transferase
MAASGYQAASGDADRAPLRIAVPQGFLHAGAEAAVGTQIALRERKRSGKGQHVDVSAQQAAAACTQGYILAAAWNENPIARASGGVRLGPLQTRFTYPASDGYVSCTFLFGPAIGPASKRLIDWAYEEGYCDDSMHEKDYIGYTALLLSGKEPVTELFRMYETVAAFTATKTKAELFEGALKRGLVMAPIATIEDTWGNEHFQARDYWQPAEPGGETRYPGPFAKLSETPIQYRRPAPKLGEHNAEVFAELAGD